MSEPSISTAESPPGQRLLPGVQVSATGVVVVEGRVLAGIGAPVPPLPGPAAQEAVVCCRLDAGPRWFAEQVVVRGTCVLLRLRPRPGAWLRAWQRWRGEASEREQGLAATWRLPLSQSFGWGVLESGVAPALRGAAVLVFRVAELPAGLPPAARVFWRQRTARECRALVSAATAAARSAGVWSCSSEGIAFADGACVPARSGMAELAGALPVGFVWQESATDLWRARGEYAGWRFTLAYAESAGAWRLRWALARLDVADDGPWDPLLEAALHRAHAKWLGKGRAVNDTLARTGAELLLEWG